MDLEVGGRPSLADQAAVGVLTRTFPVELVDRVIDQYWRREQRTRALPARLVFYFTLVLCLFPHESYRSAMAILMSVFGRGGRGYRVPTTGSIGDARRRLGAGPMETVARAVMKPLARQETQGSWYREWLLAAVDGTTFTVPDTEDNEREFGRPGSGRGEGRTAYPQIQAACLVELGTHAVFDARMDAYAAGEAMLIEEMFPSLRPGMLLLADRHVYSFRRWLAAAATGADLAWRVSANLILVPSQYLGDGSFIAEITPPKSSGQRPFRLRAIEYSLPGSQEVYRLVTTVLDPVRAPAAELAAVYHQRWDVEGFFKQVKSVQLNEEKIFRSKSPEGVRQEFWAHLAVHYATMCVQVDAADQALLDPDRISHKNTVRVLRSRIWRPESFPPAPQR
ncbi:IS4 family transposase [Lentzea sp. BCCO 10_0798]|uniref:IS4 family transposase n=1 Tax=Lentzea kristufekii TaxID=3095430 RepID=A0ABU4U859_9PSEU|nr:IS4 family transposase [Lentzea sp. BCCO 10_0798]MDX8056784.1 IS4 family transposase [Lentzea sp. BCCO 10_0798]